MSSMHTERDGSIPNTPDATGAYDGEARTVEIDLPVAVGPQDDDCNEHHRMVKCIFILLGVGLFLPWNAFVSASEYFEARLCIDGNKNQHQMVNDQIFSSVTASNSSHNEQSDPRGDMGSGENNFVLWFGLIYNLTGVITLAVMLILQRGRHGMVNKSGEVSIEEQRLDNRHTVVEDEIVEPLLQTQSENLSHLQPGDQSVDRDFDLDNDMHFALTRKRQWRMIVLSFSFYLLVMAITASLVLVPTIDPFLFQVISLTSSAVCGISGAIVMAGIVSFASIFPPMLGIQPHMSGQGVGGVVISMLDVVLSSMEKNGVDVFWQSHCDNTSLMIAQEDEHANLHRIAHETQLSASSSPSSCPHYEIDWGAFCYFAIGCLCTMTCIGLYIYLDNHPVTAYYWALQRKDVMIADRSQHGMTNDSGLLPNAIREEQLNVPLLNGLDHHEDVAVGQNNAQRSSSIMAVVWRRIRCPTISVFVTLICSLTIFPSWTTKLESTQQCMDKTNRLENDLYVPIFIVLFNVFDLCGRMTSGWMDESVFHESTFQKKLSNATYARLVFLPLFLLFKASGSVLISPFTIIYHDWFQVISMVLFAFTSGFVSTTSFVHGTILTPKSEEAQHISSTILNFAVNGGCLVGSLLSFVYNYMGTGQW